MNQRVAVETACGETAFTSGNFIASNAFVRQLTRDLEFDRNEIVALNLPGPTSDDERLDGGQPLLAAKRFTRRGDDRRRVGIGRLPRRDRDRKYADPENGQSDNPQAPPFRDVRLDTATRKMVGSLFLRYTTARAAGARSCTHSATRVSACSRPARVRGVPRHNLTARGV